jgi:HlyD family secretion protein
MNPDLKVFTTQIYLDGNDSDMRTGMSCQARIIIETHDNVLSVPVQAVLRVEGVPTVYVRSGSEFVPRKVEIGLDNNRLIHVKQGLSSGDVVLLPPPLREARKDASLTPDREKLIQNRERSRTKE